MKFIFPKDVQGWLSPEEGEILFKLAQINPQIGCVVELGCFHGRSTVCLAQGSKKVDGGKVYAIDNFVGDTHIGIKPDFYGQFIKNIRRFYLEDCVQAIRGDTQEVAGGWRKPIRLLFIDAGHLYEDVKGDFEAWGRYVAPGGIIAFHDSEWTEVYKFICQLIQSGKIKNFRAFRGKGSTGLTYASKVGNNESIPWLKRYQSLLTFKLIFLSKFWPQFKQRINERGGGDIWFEFFGTLANFWRKVRK